jgi:hypothetical protein
MFPADEAAMGLRREMKKLIRLDSNFSGFHLSTYRIRQAKNHIIFLRLPAVS